MSRTRLAIGGAFLAVALTASSVVFGQDPNPASPSEVIYARKTLMNSIAANMYPIGQWPRKRRVHLGNVNGVPASLS